jgi:23S rRNA (guanosine2251-2'-O)-methyltransferase
MRTYEHLPPRVNLKTHEKLPVAPNYFTARRELAAIPNIRAIIGTIMSQRKQKSGKPGNRPGKPSQQSDRKGKFPTVERPFKGPEKPRSAKGLEQSRRPGPRDDRRADRPDNRRRAEQADERAWSRAERVPSGGGNRPAERSLERRPERRPESKPTQEQSPRPPRRDRDDGKAGGPYWLFGQHAVAEAIRNPARRFQRLVSVTGNETTLPEPGSIDKPLPLWESMDRHSLEQLLPEGAVHQGIAARVSPLEELDLLDICEQAAEQPEATVVILDQVTDPHNVGAILRSAAAFGAIAVILTERHTAPESGTLAKSASGALEHVPLVRVSNLARAMEQLKQAGFWLAGLAAEGKTTLAGAKLSGKVGLVMGAEGAGLRRLTRDHCDLLVRLPTGGAINHLNVSNAAAVALYELARLRD